MSFMRLTETSVQGAMQTARWTLPFGVILLTACGSETPSEPSTPPQLRVTIEHIGSGSYADGVTLTLTGGANRSATLALGDAVLWDARAPGR